MARGDGDPIEVRAKKLSEDRLLGEVGEGDRGDFGEGVGDFEVTRWKVGPREGELERERRRERIAAAGSG